MPTKLLRARLRFEFVRHVIRDLNNLSQNDPSGELNEHCPDLSGALGPHGALPLIVPLDVCRDFTSHDHEIMTDKCLLRCREPFDPAKARGVTDCAHCQKHPPTTAKNPRADFS